MADQGRPRLGVKSRAHEIMAVSVVAFQGHKQVALFDGAGVDRQPIHFKGASGRAQGGGLGFAGRPEAHAARPPSATASATACSRSEKGNTSPFTYCPVSCPLPAMISTSPTPKAATAA